MPKTPYEFPDAGGEVARLITAAVEGVIDEAGRQRLAELLREDRAALRLYSDLMLLDAMLERELSKQAPAAPGLAGSSLAEADAPPGAGDARDPMATTSMISRALREDDFPAEPEPLRLPSTPARSRALRWWERRPVRVAAAFATLLIGGLVAYVALRPRNTVPTGPVATLAATIDAVWDGPATDSGTTLLPGRRMRLRAGFARVAFDDGAAVVLQGPADFEVADANGGTLYDGKLVALVTPRASGFHVRSSNLLVTDRGTEFGMSVTPAGVAEVCVFQGQVDVALPPALGAPTGPPLRLTRDLAVRCPVAGGAVQAIPATSTAFVRALPPPAATQPAGQPPAPVVPQAVATSAPAEDAGRRAGPLPGPGYDVGKVGVAGSDAYSPADGAYTVSGSGEDMWYLDDGFHFVSVPLTGNVTVVARVVSQTKSNSSAKAGVMIRASNSPNAAFADVVITPRKGVAFQWHRPNGVTLKGKGNNVGADASAPVWVKVSRTGDTCAGYFSTDGQTWNPLGSEKTVKMPASVLVGLAVTAVNNAATSTARFDHVSIIRSPD